VSSHAVGDRHERAAVGLAVGYDVFLLVGPVAGNRLDGEARVVRQRRSLFGKGGTRWKIYR
jgi:hypothetical protein